MADWYVWSGATGAGTGADWANAFVNLSSISTKAAGDRFFVAHDHLQTQASALAITSPGTEATPCRIFCVDRSGSVPPVVANLRNTATVMTTGANSITLAGSIADCYGILFSAGDAANSASIIINNTISRFCKLTNCALKLNTTAAAARINVNAGSGGNLTILDNVTMQFGSVSQAMSTYGKAIWRNTAAALVGATIPTTLLGFSNAGTWFVEGVDLSAMGAGKTICNTTGTSNTVMAFTLKDCKLGAGAVATTPTSSTGQSEVAMIRCDSIDTGYRSEKYNYMGTQAVDTATVLTGGASDGAQPISWKITTSANTEYEYPFESLPITIWNDTAGSAKTLTLQGIWGTAGLPNNDDIWIDVQYLGTSGFPLASRVSSSKGSGLAASAACPAGTGTWSGSTTKFALSVTFTPQKKGFVTVYVCAAKVSSIFFVDPKPVIT